MAADWGSAAWFREARETLGLSQTAIAVFLGYSDGKQVSRLERGIHKHRPVAQALLMDAYLSGYRPNGWPDGA